MEHLRHPNESTEYRAARNALLNDEIALRAQMETVAAKRRALPPGSKVSEDYVFERIGKNATAALPITIGGRVIRRRPWSSVRTSVCNREPCVEQANRHPNQTIHTRLSRS
jgi:hypothetical protein